MHVRCTFIDVQRDTLFLCEMIPDDVIFIKISVLRPFLFITEWVKFLSVLILATMCGIIQKGIRSDFVQIYS